MVTKGTAHKQEGKNESEWDVSGAEKSQIEKEG